MNILNLFCKSFPFSIIVIFLLIHPKEILAHRSDNPGIIRISGIYGADTELEYNITNCSSQISNAIYGQIFRILTDGNCVNIYQLKNCQGHFVRYIGGSVYVPRDSPIIHKWLDNGTLVIEPFFVHSVGPCFDKCDPRNWEGASEASPTMTLYDHWDFHGRETMVELKSDDCYVLPKQPKGSVWHSLKISGHESSSCVELHKEPSCGGESTQFRPDYPYLDNLDAWGVGGGVAPFRAVSRCGAFCGKNIPQVKALEPLENPGPGVVTYYDYFGYYGNATNVNLTGGCVGLELDKEEDILSIRTYGQCVIFYGLPRCEERQGYYSLQLGRGMEKEYYIEKFLTRTIPAPPRSLGLCPSVQTVDKVMTQGPPTAVQQMEIDKNCSEKVEILEKMLADSFPNWIIYVQPFCWLLIFVGGVLFDAFILKRREKNSEGFNVAYKS